MKNYLKSNFFIATLLLIFSLSLSSLSTLSVHAASYQLYNPSINSCHGTRWNSIYFGNYFQSDTSAKKKEPIRWRVLSVHGNDAFLIADKNLDVQPYNISNTSTTWEKSSLRKWLNTTFLNTAFTPAEQQAIMNTTVNNMNNPHFGTLGGSTTTDKIYLPSLSEISQSSYGFYYDIRVKNHARLGANTTYVASKKSMNANNRPDCYWLRSPGYISSYACRINETGYGDIYGLSANTTDFAVRPVLHLNLGYYRYWKKGPDILSQNDVSYQKKSVSKIKVAKPARTRIYSTKLLKKKHILKIKYKKVSNITGYEIQYSKNPKFKNKKIIYSKKSFIKINFRKNSTYYIRVRTYNSVPSKKITKYSKWSLSKKVSYKNKK